MDFDIRKNRAYRQRLRHTVINLFLILDVEERSIKEIAGLAKLSVQTVTNLRSGKTKLPRYSTIYQLAVAADMVEYVCGTGESK